MKAAFPSVVMTSTMMTPIILMTAMFMTSAVAQRMRIPGESGPQVVEEVVDQVRSSCVLPQDNLLLRRLAYVESRDGTDPDTYRIGFDGGIWQVTEAMYNVTKTASDLSEARTAIGDHLMVDWSATYWSDLRAPLFSGLAAALFIRHSLNGSHSPVGVASQQEFWNKVYHRGTLGTNNTYYSDLVKLMEKGCHAGQPLIDLLFILDTSSSISDDDFESSKAFVTNITSQLDMTQQHTRVAVITYSSGAQVRISWGQHQGSHAELSQAIQALGYQRGGTETDDALDLARDSFVKEGRSEALKVLVLVTDGESHDPIDTKHAASRLTAAVPGILVLVVGVGSQVNQDEMQSIATAPACKHMFRVDTYDQIDALREEILRITCRAPVILHPGQTVTCAESICPPYMVEQPPGKKIMVEANTDCPTQQTLYGSPTVPYPTSTLFSKSLALGVFGGGVMSLPRNYNLTAPSFYNLMLEPGSRGPCLVSVQSVIDVIKVVCIERGQQRDCTPADIQNYKLDTGNSLC